MFLFVTSVLLLAATARAATCGSGGVDLSSLTKPAGSSGYVVPDTSQAAQACPNSPFAMATGITLFFQYNINLCADAGPDGGMQKCQPDGSMVCQNTKDSTSANPWVGCGLTSTAAWSAAPASPTGAAGVTVAVTGGNMSRSSTINVYCDAKLTTPSTPCLWKNDPPIHYEFHMNAAAACGGGGGGSGGTIFIVLLIVGLVLYCGAGAAYQWKMKDAHGMDLIPNKGFWFDLPSLVKDGVMFTVGKATGKGSYSSV